MEITDVAEGKRNKDRVNVYLDGEFAFACYLETALQYGIKKGAAISEESVRNLLETDGVHYAMQQALKYVSHKPRTQKEIEDKLRERKLDASSIDAAVEKLKEYGYINDAEYACQYAEELRQKYGGRVIKERLLRKGIDRDIAQKLADEGNKDTLRAQYALLQEKHKNEEPRKKRDKIVRALMTRGFLWDDIKQVMGGEYEE